MTRLMGKGNKEKCWLSHFQHQHEIVIEGGRGAILLNELTDPVYLIFGKLYLSDILKKQSVNRIFAIKLYIHILIIISYIIIDIPKH